MKNNNSEGLIALVICVGVVLLQISLFVAVIWIAYHFISKYW